MVSFRILSAFRARSRLDIISHTGTSGTSSRMCTEISVWVAGAIPSTVLSNCLMSVGGNYVSCVKKAHGNRRVLVGSYSMRSTVVRQKQTTRATRPVALLLGDPSPFQASHQERGRTPLLLSRPPPLLRRMMISRKWRSTKR